MKRFSVNRFCWVFFSSILALTLVAAGFLGGGTTRVNAQDETPRGGSVEELGPMPMVSEEGISSKEASSPPIPAVDGVACTDAWPISVGEYDDWTTIGAGSTDNIDSYPISAWDESGREYIYSFSTSAASIITVVLSNLSVDLDIFVLDGGPSGACNSLNAIAAGDSVTSFYALSNHVYYLVVDGFGGAEGTYRINVYSNDKFYSPFYLGDYVPDGGALYTTGATHDPGDPSFAICGQATGNASVWFVFDAPRDGEVSIDTFGSNYDTMLGVWQNTPGDLMLMGCSNDVAGKKQSQVSFPVLAGQQFFIGVAQKGAETGGFLSLHLTSFADVPGTHPLWRYVEGFFRQGITTGCATNPMRYCPDQVVTRGQMAVFLLRSLHAYDLVPYVPADVNPDIFSDTPVAAFMEPWIEQFYAVGLTTGCATSPLRFCPEKGITRGEMAIFLLRAKFGPGYVPMDIEPDIFIDPPANAWMEPWIEQFYMLGYTTGCSGSTPGVDLKYCPGRGAGRAEMATFIDRVFEFPPLP